MLVQAINCLRLDHAFADFVTSRKSGFSRLVRGFKNELQGMIKGMQLSYGLSFRSSYRFRIHENPGPLVRGSW